LWWDCHHVISRFSMGHNGTFSTCRVLGSTLVIKPSSHTENDFGLWFLLIFLAARCQHCRHKYRCSESAALSKKFCGSALVPTYPKYILRVRSIHCYLRNLKDPHVELSFSSTWPVLKPLNPEPQKQLSSGPPGDSNPNTKLRKW
jgi:hypothetical protein